MEYIFQMVISSEFRMGQYRDDDHREDAPHLTIVNHGLPVKIIFIGLSSIQTLYSSVTPSQIIDLPFFLLA